MKERILALLEKITDERQLEAIYWFVEGFTSGRWGVGK